MSAAPVKLSLADKKAIRDSEPELKKACDTITAAAGTSEPYTIDLTADYTGVLSFGKPMENKYCNVGELHQYYTALADNIAKHCAADEGWKATFVKRTSARTVALKIVDDMYALRARTDTGDVFVEGNSGEEVGLQMIDGKIFILTTPSKYGYSLHRIGHRNLSGMFKPEAGELSLTDKKLIRDRDEKIRGVLARLEKASGLAPLTWDVEADAKAVYENKTITQSSGVIDGLIAYMTGLAEAFESQLKEELLREAVAEVMSAKKVGVKVVESSDVMKKLPMVAFENSNSAIQFADGQAYVVAPKDRWFVDTNSIQKHKLMPLF